ncbi:MAG: DUF4296 domain-containing protein [Bacteroidaceae bacterium]|nr:DUF4296 domain-containing protein [Bacteroidaceae bacterium]
MKQHIIIFILLAVAALTACEKTPEGILSKGDMEDVLFDYHLLQGMIDQMNSEQREENQRYLDAVLRKHGITQAEFDSSMVWYNRNGVLLKEIYKDLNDRYKALDEELKLKSGSNNILTTISQTGDTANIWTGNQLLLLRPKDLLNKEVFTLKADTSFYRKDKFKLYATVYFVREIRDERESNLTVGLTIEYKNGKTIGATRTVDYNGPLELGIDATDDEDIEALHGYFFYRGKETMRNLCIVSKMALVRMHDKTTPLPQPTDSIAGDTLKADSVALDTTPDLPHRHLTPEEVRLQNKTMDRIQIKAAPDVRTKNSYGPRRKKNAKKNSRQ